MTKTNITTLCKTGAGNALHGAGQCIRTTMSRYTEGLSLKRDSFAGCRTYVSQPSGKVSQYRGK